MDVRDYELTVLVPAGAEDDMEKTGKKLAEILKKSSVKVNKEAKAAKKALAYEINKLHEAVYYFYEIEADPAAITELDRKLRLEDNIIRHLLVKTEK